MGVGITVSDAQSPVHDHILVLYATSSIAVRNYYYILTRETGNNTVVVTFVQCHI